MVLRHLFSCIYVGSQLLQNSDRGGKRFGLFRKAMPVFGFLGEVLFELAALFLVLAN